MNGAIAAGRTTHRKMTQGDNKPISNGPLHRLRSESGENIGIDTLQAIADFFDIPAWQLIHPAFDPAALPHHPRLSQRAIDLGLQLDKISDIELHKVIAAVAMQVVSMNPAAAAALAQAQSPAPPEPPASPSPAPKPKHARRR